MSLDIKDLYYSLDSVLLLERVRELLEKNLVSFQAKAGISVDAVLELLTCYLKATVLDFNGDCYIQRKGVCIGSAVAPVLTEFYLNALGRKITELLALWELVGFWFGGLLMTSWFVLRISIPPLRSITLF
ncbi:unnamed protein product [Ixodes hexagonus]